VLTGLAAELAGFPVLAGLAEDDLQWLADRCTVVELQPGDVLLRPGDPPDTMHLILEGELHAIPESKAKDGGRLYILRAREITGMLPFSRMTRIPRLATAATYMRIAEYPASRFPEMLQRIPALEPRMVALLADRIKQTTQTEQQAEKLASLGRLAAGLAHELNNPAAAAYRAASSLRATFAEAEAGTARLTATIGLEAVGRLTEMRRELARRPTRHLSTLERGDLEDELGSALDEMGFAEAWRIAPPLVDSGVDRAWLDGFLAAVPTEARTTALQCLECHLRAAEVLRTVEEAAERITRLVGAVKQYTFMDRAALQEIDVHEGLNSTLRILSSKLARVTVKREYAPDLPRITGYGAELNQVWTNILDNAADALDGDGEILIRTSANGKHISVEIRDNGPGMSPEIVARVFDPFFSTKGVGSGTGLGMDIARRIVEQHRGSIQLESQPGTTSFRIELPITGPAAPESSPSHP
jgi:signal transduction histidine kinase